MINVWSTMASMLLLLSYVVVANADRRRHVCFPRVPDLHLHLLSDTGQSVANRKQQAMMIDSSNRK